MARRRHSTKEVIIEDVAEAASVSYAPVSHETNAQEKAQSETYLHVQQTTINPHNQLQPTLHIFSLVDSLSQIIKRQILNLVVQYIGKIVQGFADILTADLYHHLLSITNYRQRKEPTYTNMMICHMFGDLHLASPVV
jgi:DNA-binding LacI/PurR family transcriptional regulator